MGTVLISTAGGTIDPVTWLPALVRPAVRAAMPSMMTGASKGRIAEVVERGRRSGSDIAFLGTRRNAFGDPNVSPTLVDFLARLIRTPPIPVLALFHVAIVGSATTHHLLVIATVPTSYVT